MSIRNAGEIASDAVKAALKAERARVRRMVRAVKTGSMLKYRPLAGAALASYREACDDILAKLKEGR